MQIFIRLIQLNINRLFIMCIPIYIDIDTIKNQLYIYINYLSNNLTF